MSDTNILEFRSLRPAPAAAVGTGGYRLSGTQAAVAAPSPVSKQISGRVAIMPIEIDKLYPADKDFASDMLAALVLLAEAIDLLEKARAARNKEPMIADRYWQRFQCLLPRLFAHRKIGDGYGAIINAVHFSCINQHGVPLSFDQLTTVWRVMKQLRSTPAIAFEQSLRHVQEIEESHLQIYPATISELFSEPDE
jgi:hypothetical protein